MVSTVLGSLFKKTSDVQGIAIKAFWHPIAGSGYNVIENVSVTSVCYSKVPPGVEISYQHLMQVS